MKPTMAEIITAVAAEFKISPREITGRLRHKIFSRPRFIVYAIAHDAGYSFPVIANRLGDRDHATVLQGARRAMEIAANDAAYTASLNSLRKTLLTDAADAAHINGMAGRDAKVAKATIAALRNHIAPEALHSAKSHGFAATVGQRAQRADMGKNVGVHGYPTGVQA